MSGWPFFELELVARDLVLRPPTDIELLDLLPRAAGRVLPPERAHLMGPWTQIPEPDFTRKALVHHWQQRAELSPESWNLLFGVFPKGSEMPVGAIGVGARDFVSLRSLGLGYWLLPEARGRGYSASMLDGVLTLGFKHLEALEARLNVHPDNRSSARMAERAGFKLDGTEMQTSGAGPRLMNRYRLEATRWRERQTIQVKGLEPCLELLGVPQVEGDESPIVGG